MVAQWTAWGRRCNTDFTVQPLPVRASYALEVYAKHPNRFGLVRPFDPGLGLPRRRCCRLGGYSGVVGARIMLTAKEYEADEEG
ncbi:MAG: hypothetical protein Ct9H300mP11_29220 [Chloroflexota bacterium]|nr:MAG: hypothetical protein Ct9H300mP11_29220 [Chloroflexota bacterium]